MIWKKTLSLALILALIVGYYYYFEVKKAKEHKDAEDKAKKIFQIDKDKISELKLVRQDETIVLKKEANDWQIEEPIATKADKSAVDNILGGLADAEVERDMGEKENELETFGLKTPELTVTAKEGEGGQTKTILFGKKNPMNSFVYAQRENEKPILLVRAYTRTRMDKTLLDIRDKTVLEMQKDEANTIKLTKRGGPAMVLEKVADEGWKMTAPAEMRVDSDKVNKILQKIQDAKVKEFIEDKPEDLVRYGLDAPQWEVNILLGGDKASKTLLVGNSLEEEKEPAKEPKPGSTSKREGLYARRDTAETVFTLPKNFLDDFPTDAEAWRDKSVCFAKQEDIQRFELRTPGNALLLAKNDKNEWMIEQPLAEKADSMDVSDFLYALTRTKAEEFLPSPGADTEYGFDAPRVQVQFWKKDSTDPQTIILGKDKEGSEDSYLKTSQGQVALVKRDDVKDLQKTPFDFRSKTLISFDRTKIKLLEVAKGDEKFVFEQPKKDKWNLKEKPKGVKLAKEDPGDLLMSINYLNMKKIVEEPAGDDLAKYGLDKPQATLSVTLDDDTVMGPVLIGGEAPSQQKAANPASEKKEEGEGEEEKRLYALLKPKNIVCTVSADILKDIARDIGELKGEKEKEEKKSD